MDTLMQWIQWLFLFGCVLPLVVMIVLAVFAFYFGRKWVADFIEPDLPKLQEKMHDMKAKNPNIDDDTLIAKVVHQQALKCGIVGAITGFGGFFTLPITLPVDLLLTARYQATMISFIAQVHGFENSLENKAATYAVMTGSTEITQALSTMIQQYVPRVIGKSFSKLIPIIGAFFAFVVNYVMARSIAKAATVWYRSNAREAIITRIQLDSAT